MLGVVEYSDESEFKSVLGQVNQTCNDMDIVLVNDSELRIEFQYCVYNSFGMETDFLFTKSATGRIVGALKKPSWYGFVHTEEIQEETDLYDWASETRWIKTKPEPMEKTVFDGDDAFNDDGSETKKSFLKRYTDWKNNVEQNFIKRNFELEYPHPVLKKRLRLYDKSYTSTRWCGVPLFEEAKNDYDEIVTD
jgi:hypothetical protein